jgi:hypothetical protein
MAMGQAYRKEILDILQLLSHIAYPHNDRYNRSRYSLSDGIIKSFYIVCLASILSYCSRSFLRKNYPIIKDKSLYNLQHSDDIPPARESQSP